MDLNWYLIMTKPRNEARAYENLMRQGYHCYLPKIGIEKIRNRQVVINQEPLFPRYLFVQLSSTEQNWIPIRSTLGVSNMVRFGSEFAKIPPSVIADIENFAVAHEEEIFTPGEKLIITSGPFKGIEAEFKLMDGDSRAFVLIEMLNKIQTIKVSVAEIAPVFN